MEENTTFRQELFQKETEWQELQLKFEQIKMESQKRPEEKQQLNDYERSNNVKNVFFEIFRDNKCQLKRKVKKHKKRQSMAKDEPTEDDIQEVPLIEDGEC